MYAIPVTPFTLDLIQSLNGGVRPQIEQEPTYFLTHTANGFNTFITEDQFKSLSHDKKSITITYLA